MKRHLAHQIALWLFEICHTEASGLHVPASDFTRLIFKFFISSNWVSGSHFQRATAVESSGKRDGRTPARKHDALSLQIRQCCFMKTINDNNHDHIDNFRSVFVAYYLHWERVQSSTPSITSLNKKIQTVEPDRYIGSLPYIALQKSLSVGLY